MGLTNAERQRRFIDRLKAQAGGEQIEALKARCAALESEIAALKTGGRKRRKPPPASASPAERTRLGVVALIEEACDFDTGYPDRVRAFLKANTPTKNGKMHLRDAIYMVSENLLTLSNDEALIG